MALQPTIGLSLLLNRNAVIALLGSAASFGLQFAVPIIWPNVDRRVGVALIVLSLLALVAAGVLAALGRKSAGAVQRRWVLAGMGQGWMETRVRNNRGEQLTVTSNPGSDANQINIDVTFRKRTRPRRSETVEMIIQVDGKPFEWDIPDPGGVQFELKGETWRGVQALKIMLDDMRRGTTVTVLVPSLELSASFTLEGAYDVLEDAAALGDGD